LPEIKYPASSKAKLLWTWKRNDGICHLSGVCEYITHIYGDYTERL